MTAADELVAALPTGSATCRALAAERIGWYVQILFVERHHPDTRLHRLAWTALAIAVDHEQAFVAARIGATLVWEQTWMLRRQVSTVQAALAQSITGGACAGAAC